MQPSHYLPSVCEQMVFDSSLACQSCKTSAQPRASHPSCIPHISHLLGLTSPALGVLTRNYFSGIRNKFSSDVGLKGTVNTFERENESVLSIVMKISVLSIVRKKHCYRSSLNSSLNNLQVARPM